MGEGGREKKGGKLDGEGCAQTLATRPNVDGLVTGVRPRRKRRKRRRLRRIGEKDKTTNSSRSGGRVRNVWEDG